MMNFIKILIFFTFLNLIDSKCTNNYNNNNNNNKDFHILLKAFNSTSNFNPSFLKNQHFSTNCSSPITEINLSFRNLSGTISWKFLRNLSNLHSLDLSHNTLEGYVPNWVWTLKNLQRINLSYNQFGGILGFSPLSSSSSVVQSIDLSHNRFTKLGNFSGFFNLIHFDVSHNNFKGLLSSGFFKNMTKLEFFDVSNCNLSGNINSIKKFKSLKHLDVSNNNLIGKIPFDFPPLDNLKFLNISFNKFSGKFPQKYYKKFGKSSFLNAGDNNFTVSTVKISPKNSKKPIKKHIPIKNNKKTIKPNSKKRKLKIILAMSFSVLGVVVLGCVTVYLIHRRIKLVTRQKKWVISKPTQVNYTMEKSGPLNFETSSGATWTVEMKEVTSARVVMFEKPLMRLCFKDLVTATCGFGRESQLAEGRCGPLYRAILPGDLHVAVKVLENARGFECDEVVRLFEDLALLKHPNLLPISGYCIAGKEKLVLSEYMSNGDLHSWLHELPPGKTNVDDWSTDTWEYQNDPESTINDNITPSPEKLNWLTRHRIALGMARGLAYLHHARSKPMVHGHLVPSNILLSDELEPRIADFGMCLDGNVGSAEEDVFGFGLIIIELLTGQSISSEGLLGQVRKSVRDGNGSKMLDRRLKLDDDSITKAAVECLRVGYLCTAESSSKRPTMQQVVGLLKDIRP